MVTVTVTVTWAAAGAAIITDGAEAEGIITDGGTTTDDFSADDSMEAGRPMR